jgi:hypothetical protein
MVYFQTKSQNVQILSGLVMEQVGIVCGHVEYITGILVYFMVMW